MNDHSIEKRLGLLHPFIFGIWAILFLFHYNIGELSAKVLLLPIMTNILAVAAVFLLLSIFIKDKGKTALIILVFLAIFYSFGHIIEVLNFVIGLNIHVKDSFYIALIMLLFFLITAFLILKTKRDFSGLNLLLTGVTFMLAMTITIQIACALFKQRRDINISRTLFQPTLDIKKADDKAPDIYYIILDGYAGFEVLKKYYGYQNDSFKDRLKKNGFFVAERSFSNYSITYTSLASSLNMAYLDDVRDKVGKGSSNFKILGEMIKNNLLLRSLRKAGYGTIFYSSGCFPTKLNPYADENIVSMKVNEFLITLIRTTMLKSIFERTPLFKKQLLVPVIISTLRKNIREDKKPRFIMVHIPSPHPPYVFRADGSVYDEVTGHGWFWDSRPKYVEELKYISDRIAEYIEILLSRSKIKPVIILQSDHGPFLEKGTSMSDNIIARTGILNAYHFPVKCRDLLYDSISPVNSFRVTLNCLFGADIPLLPDEAYWSGSGRPFDFKNVTKRIR